MKTLKAAASVLVLAGALAGFGWFFVSQLGGRQAEGPAGVLLTPPPGYVIVERGEMAPGVAAAELADQIQASRADRVGLKFQRNGSAVYWLADVSGDQLEELAGANGTRVQTVWRGGLRQRLAWGRDHGDFVCNVPLPGPVLRDRLTAGWQAAESLAGWPAAEVARLVAEKYSLVGWNRRR